MNNNELLKQIEYIIIQFVSVLREVGNNTPHHFKSFDFDDFNFESKYENFINTVSTPLIGEYIDNWISGESNYIFSSGLVNKLETIFNHYLPDYQLIQNYARDYEPTILIFRKDNKYIKLEYDVDLCNLLGGLYRENRESGKATCHVMMYEEIKTPIPRPTEEEIDILKSKLFNKYGLTGYILALNAIEKIKYKVYANLNLCDSLNKNQEFIEDVNKLAFTIFESKKPKYSYSENILNEFDIQII